MFYLDLFCLFLNLLYFRLRVYLKLFLLMGANWVTEALSWALPKNQWFFYLTDVTTTLQGVLVFVLFVCRPSVLNDLRTRLGFGCLQDPTENNAFHSSVRSDNSRSTCVTVPSPSLEKKDT